MAGQVGQVTVMMGPGEFKSPCRVASQSQKFSRVAVLHKLTNSSLQASGFKAARVTLHFANFFQPKRARSGLPGGFRGEIACAGKVVSLLKLPPK